MESMWVDDEDCAKVIEDSWQQPAQGSFSHQLVQRLQLCQRKLIQWSKGAFPNNRILLSAVEITTYLESYGLPLQ